MRSLTVRRVNITSRTIAYYSWWGRVIVSCIVIGCVDVSWIVHFTLHWHHHVYRWLRDALPMDTLLVITSYLSHLRVLKRDMHW